jgi:outer membrane protein assembly factor BamB
MLALGGLLAAVLLCPLSASNNPANSAAELIASTESPWPQFRGPRRDGVSDERGLLQAWPEGGPKLLWSAKGAGRGFSSPIFGGDRFFVTGDFDGDLHVLAFDLHGKPVWRAKNGAGWLNQYPGARASVTFSNGRVYQESAHGRLACFDAVAGKEIWSVDLLARYGGENITWGLSECVVVDERAVYACAGGRDALMVAFDKMTGAELWRSAPLFHGDDSKTVDNAGYAAPILVRFAGRRLLIGASQRHLFCVDADTGKLQWARARPTSYSVLAMTPVLIGDGVFMTAPFGPPGALHRLVAPATKDAVVGVEDTWTTSLDAAQNGVVYADGKLFGSFYPRRGGWAALDATNGETLAEAPDIVKGCAVYADGRLYALCEDGTMLLLSIAGKEFVTHGKFKLTTGRDRDAWAHPVIVERKLYLRYHDTVFCYDIAAKN